MQHVNIKIFAREGDVDISKAVPVFHRWIQKNWRPELLIDVADYKHVPDGPGVMLIGHQADYSLDEADGRLGVLYNRKAGVDGNGREALRQAFASAVAAAKQLEGEAEFGGTLKFDAGDVELIINDRVVAPNTEATWTTLKPEIEKFFADVYGAGSFTLERRGEPRERFRVGVKANAPVEVAAVEKAIS